MYENAHRSTVDPDTAVRVMGFSGKSGASAVALGAVRQFGLVDGLRGAIRISDLALRILQPSSREEEADARREAASRPDIYSAVLAHFDGELPRSDEPVKAFLIRTMEFSQNGAEDCISALRKTMDELAANLEINSVASVENNPHQSVQARDIQTRAKNDHSQSSGLENEFVRIPLARDCYAELRLFGQVTDSAVDRLIRYIELMKGAWAEA